MNEKKFTVTTSISATSAKELIYGMNQFCNAGEDGVFSWTLEHYLHRNPNLTPQENALEFLNEYFNQLAGTFRMIAAATDILSEALANEDLIIMARGEE